MRVKENLPSEGKFESGSRAQSTSSISKSPVSGFLGLGEVEAAEVAGLSVDSLVLAEDFPFH